MIGRREAFRYLGAGALGMLLPLRALASDDDRSSRSTPDLVPADTGAHGRVLVVGGGMAGATAAKYLRLWGGEGVKVTLVEQSPKYLSCILSNGVIDGTRRMSDLSFTYDDLASAYGIEVVRAAVVEVDPIGLEVTLDDGSVLAADRLVLAPGVDFDVIPGLEKAAARRAVPHAWKAGPQTIALRNQLRAMRGGGVFVETIPLAPFRCPPGPYERACVVADYLKRHKPGSKLILLDANPGIVAERENFTWAFDVVHAGVIEYHANVSLSSIDASTRTLHTSIGSIRADVINAIPPHRAGSIIASAGLNDAGGGRWAGVDVLSYESTAAQGVHVVGDSSSTTQPKAGHIANAEAKVCADAITRMLRGQAPDPAPMTNSSCFTPITRNTASWLSAVFSYDPVSKTMKVVGGSATESRRASKDNYEQMLGWFNNLMTDTFA